MITEPTVFVLGAGASRPYGYPTGSVLKDEILKSFSRTGNRFAVNMVLWDQYWDDVNRKVHDFAKEFAGSHTDSIDLFLAGHHDDVWLNRIGRFAIADRIAAAERQHAQREQTDPTRETEGDWYRFLLRQLRGGLITKEDFIERFHENNVTIITFNYDRSLDHYLFDSLCHCFGGVTLPEVAEQMKHIQIIHVFGQIAPLPWQDPTNGKVYGKIGGDEKLITLSENLRIIYDGHELPGLDTYHQAVAEARRVFFLGFGYAKENLDILKVDRDPLGVAVYGTAYESTRNEQDTVHDDIKIAMSLDTRLEDMDSLTLLRHHF